MESRKLAISAFVVASALTLICAGAVGAAEERDPVWVQSYESGADDYGRALVVKPGGETFTVSDSFDADGSDILIHKRDASGNDKWTPPTREYDSGYPDYAKAAALLSAGGIIVIGYTDKSSVGEGKNWCIMKYGGAGAFKWAASYNDCNANMDDVAEDVAIDDSVSPNDIYVAGWSESNDGHPWDKELVVQKYQSNSSDPEWTSLANKYLGSLQIISDWAHPVHVAVDASGVRKQIYVASTFMPAIGGWGAGGSWRNYFLAKLDTTGYRADFQYYKPSSAEWTDDAELRDMVVDSDGNVYLTGTIHYHDENSYRMYTVKLNRDGGIRTPEWEVEDTLLGYDIRGDALAVDDSGNVWVACEWEDEQELTGWALLKYDANGNYQGNISFYGLGKVPEAILVDSLDRVIVTARGDSRYDTFCFDSSFNYLWYDLWAGGSYDAASQAMGLDDLDNLYVTGFTKDETGDYDATTLKYTPWP